MASEKYLYGFTVESIQSFIFETGKLKEILGASEMVEQICTEKFKEIVNQYGAFNEQNLLVGAAGKITYVFDDQTVCEKVVYGFQRSILTEAPGLNLSQAVVKISGDHVDGNSLSMLESRLETQKNRAFNHHGLGLMIAERSRRTGGAAVEVDTEGSEGYLDRRQAAKVRYQRNGRDTLFEKILGIGHGFKKGQHFALEPEQMLSGQSEGGWVAVVHADGNSLGQTIQRITEEIGQKYPNSNVLQIVLKTFSEKLDAATKQSAKEAFERIVKPVYDKELDLGRKPKLPLRPIILGGDDLTLIIRGELAVPFTEVFLKRFNHHTKNNFSQLASDYLPMLKDGLSACAGIAFIKPKYPFHYGVDLAESLCSYAKEKAKSISSTPVPSCLAFHRVESAFVDDYKTICQRELLRNGIRMHYGPYFINHQSGYSTVGTLLNQARALQEDDAPKAPIREWLKVLAENRDKAVQLMERIKSLNSQYITRLNLNQALMQDKEARSGEPRGSTHLYDVMALESIGKIEKYQTL